MTHYGEAACYFETAGNFYHAAIVCFRVAVGLLSAGRLADALEYAQAALRGFSTFGDRAATEIQETQGLIEKIRQRMGSG